MGTLPFFLEYAQCPNEAQKNLPHPEAQVRGGSGQQQVDRVADLAFEEVAIQSKVALEVPDPWFDRCPSAEPLSGSEFLVGTGVFLSSSGRDHLRFPAVRLVSNPLFSNRHRWAVASHPLNMLERWFQRMRAIVIFR